MGKKGGKGKARPAGSDASSDEECNATLKDCWEVAWDSTMENSASARAKGVNSLCDLLRRGFDPERALDMVDKVIDCAESCFNARRSDRALEAAVGTLLQLLFITLGRDSQVPMDTLSALLRDRCKEGKAKAACIWAYTAGAFAAGGSDHERLSALRFLAGLWLTARGADLEAALRGWSLLMASIDVRTLSTPLIEATLHHLSVHLTGSNVGVRNAAAEALGLLYTMCGLEVLPDDDDELLPPEAEGENLSCCSMDGSACAVSAEARETLEDGFQAIVARVADLAKNRGDSSRRSKGDRKSSKRAAADVLASMSGAAGQSECVKLRRGGRIVLESLAQRTAYRALASILGNALQAHLEENPLLEDALSLEQDLQDGDCKGNKKWKNGDSKPRINEQRERHRARSAKMAAHMMLDADD